MKKLLNKLRLTAFLWAAAIVLLAESPAALFIHNAARILPTAEINRIGILGIVRFSLLALFSFALGLLAFLRLKRADKTLCTGEYQRYEEQKKKKISRLILGLTAALLPLFTVAEPAINLFTGRELDAELVQIYWAWLFLILGAVLFIAGYSVIRFVLLSRLCVTLDETLPDIPKKVTGGRQLSCFRQRSCAFWRHFWLCATGAGSCSPTFLRSLRWNTPVMRSPTTGRAVYTPSRQGRKTSAFCS